MVNHFSILNSAWCSVFVLLMTASVWSSEALADLDDEIGNREQVSDDHADTEKSIMENEPDLGAVEATPMQKDKLKSENTKPVGKKIKKTAQKKASKGPIRWKSQGLLATQEKNVIELEKDVEISQDDMLLKAQYSKIIFASGQSGEVDQVQLRGGVHIERNGIEPENQVVAKANRATFYSRANKVNLEGNARLWRQGNLIKGKKIIYDLTSGWITVDRVEGVVEPPKTLGESKD